MPGALTWVWQDVCQTSEDVVFGRPTLFCDSHCEIVRTGPRTSSHFVWERNSVLVRFAIFQSRDREGAGFSVNGEDRFLTGAARKCLLTYPLASRGLSSSKLAAGGIDVETAASADVRIHTA